MAQENMVELIGMNARPVGEKRITYRNGEFAYKSSENTDFS